MGIGGFGVAVLVCFMELIVLDLGDFGCILNFLDLVFFLG